MENLELNKKEDTYLVFYYPDIETENGSAHDFSIISQLEFDLINDGCREDFSIRDLHLCKMIMKNDQDPLVDFKEPTLIKKTPSMRDALDSIKEYNKVVDAHFWGTFSRNLRQRRNMTDRNKKNYPDPDLDLDK